ncbi:MAG: amidohydrolase family protein [Phycisphaerae bacterium]
MIVDCHTQLADWGVELGAARPAISSPAAGSDAVRHLEAIDSVDRAIVLGFKSKYLAAEVSNRSVSDYVRRHSAKLIGFAGIDPTDPDCLQELRTAQDELGLKGVTLSPALQNFHPTDTRAMRLYDECARRRLPIVFEQNHMNPAAKMEFGRATLLDEVAREFPALRIVVAHMGYPWVDETIVLLGKHPHVYADVSGLLRKPWLAYTSLLAAFEHGVMNRLLFGSDFPRRSPAACIEALYSINQIRNGTGLVAIPREQLRGIVERETLSLLGIDGGATASRPMAPAPPAMDDDEPA